MSKKRNKRVRNYNLGLKADFTLELVNLLPMRIGPEPQIFNFVKARLLQTYTPVGLAERKDT